MDASAYTIPGRRKTMIGFCMGYCVYIAMDCHYDQFCEGCPFRLQWERKHREGGQDE